MFESISVRKPRKNKFNLSHERKMSLKMGNLTPFMCQEVVPGDSFRVSAEIFMRMSPLVAPIMHRVNVWTHFWYVPYRIVWPQWEDFITGGRLGTDTNLSPKIVVNTAALVSTLFDKGNLWDYFGLPVIPPATVITDVTSVSALPFACYQKIYDEFYRDQNLEAALANIDLVSGDQTVAVRNAIMSTRKRAWEKDYFTSCLPFAQRGGEAVIPMEPVYKQQGFVIDAAGNPVVGGTDNDVARSAADGGLSLNPGGGDVNIDNLESLGDTSITELRRAFRLQEWLEKAARGGARYAEQMLSFFGVRSDDYRLQRPQYLGGGRNPVTISEVLSTVENNAGTIPQGTMAGHGISYGSSNRFSQSFKEHGHIIGIMSVLPTTAYQQGIARQWKRFDKFDYYWNEFANIGEQEVKQSELYYDPAALLGTGDGTFGYQSRYAEYKHSESSVHGDFRDVLSHWHMGRIFASPPVLNTSFVQSNPTTRIFADEVGDTLWCQIYNRVDAVRPMPYFGVPSI